MFTTLLMLELLAQVAPVTPPAPVTFMDWLKANQTLIIALLVALWPFVAKWLNIKVPGLPNPSPTPTPVPNPIPGPILPVDPNPIPVPVPSPILPNHPFIAQLIQTLLPILIQVLIPQIIPVVRSAVKESVNEAVREAAVFNERAMAAGRSMGNESGPMRSGPLS